MVRCAARVLSMRWSQVLTIVWELLGILRKLEASRMAMGSLGGRDWKTESMAERQYSRRSAAIWGVDVVEGMSARVRERERKAR